MSELTLVGLDEDGEHVVLEGPDGQRFHVRIDEALRAAVRRDRPQFEQVRAEVTGTLPPREIQSRIRAGATAEELAETSGMPVEIVRRYEGPVIAERIYVVQQARATRIGHESSAPVLGDLVTDRLATRGIAATTIRWDAFRSGGSPWTVEASFDVGGTTRSARWSYDPGAHAVRALDDEARWLSETELADEPIPRRHLTAVRDHAIDVDAALRPLLAAVDLPLTPEPEPDPGGTSVLLDDLTDRRGVRQTVDLDADDTDDEAFVGFGPQHAFDFDHPETNAPVPAAHPPASRPDLAVDAQVLEMPSRRNRRRTGPEHAGQTMSDDVPHPAQHTAPHPNPGTGGDTFSAQPAPPRGRRKGRPSVPSWDEIVFGAKPE